MFDKKKILVIFLFIVVVIGLGWLLYLTFFKPAPPEELAEEVEEGEAPARLPVTREGWERMTVEERARQGLPFYEWEEEEEVVVPEIKPVEKVVPEISEVALGGLTQVKDLTNISAYSAALASDGSLYYYDSGASKFYRLLADGTRSLLSDKSFYEVKGVTWAPGRDKAILEYPDGFKVIYDFENKKQVTLPGNWSDFSFSSRGDEIAFKSDHANPNNRWLAIVDSNGSNPQLIEPLGENADKVDVAWSPNNQIIATSKTGEAQGLWQQEIYMVGKYQENFRSLIVEGRGFESKWAPQGDKLLYSVYNNRSNYSPILWITDAEGDNIGRANHSLGLQTWSHKCTFGAGGENIYCAVPRELPLGSGLYPPAADDIFDDFYKVNLQTGVKEFLAQPERDYNAEKVFLSPDGKYLYFTDKATGILHQIRLK